MSRSGIVNVRMVITEEKILNNIEKIQKMINPNSKKQIVQLDEDVFFKDLIESVKSYLIEYPKKKNFPSDIYKAAYGLVEYATNQFEENTKKIEDLIRQREENISAAGDLKELIETVIAKDENWKSNVKEAEGKFSEDIVNALYAIGKSTDEGTEEYQANMKLLNTKVGNLESNLHIEIDMERIEDRSKALSYIGIEIADALKTIPTPIDTPVQVESKEKVETIVEETKPVEEKQQPAAIVEEPVQAEVEQQYIEETTFEAKPTFWQRVKNSKFVKAIRYITKIRIVIQYPEALPEGRGENS